MTAATGTSRSTSVFQVLLAAAAAATLMFALNACQPADRAVAGKRVEAKWAERQLLFVGDPERGNIRVFHLRAAPLQVGELRAPGRNGVRDIAIDAPGQRIWVLGDAAVYLHDARSFSLVRRIPVSTPGFAALHLDTAGTPLLLNGDGAVAARIDTSQLSLESLRVARR